MPISGQLIVLSPGFPQDEQDSTCIPWLQQFLLSLRRVSPSLEVVVIAFQYPFHSREYTWHGIRVFALGGANRKTWRRLITWAKALRKFVQFPVDPFDFPIVGHPLRLVPIADLHKGIVQQLVSNFVLPQLSRQPVMSVEVNL